MAVRKIVIWPNEVLHQVSEEVLDPTSEETHDLANDLIETMLAKGGVGLAAIQIGVAQRIFVVQADKRFPPTVFINPTIKEFIDDPFLVDEGCLSLPGIYEKVLRCPEIVLAYTNLQGVDLNVQLGGLEAQCAQHECGHLNGKIFLEPMSVVKRAIYRGKIAKYLKQARR